MTENSPIFLYMFVAFGASMVPLAAIIASSFTKIAVVLFIIRNAIGIQQTPPNIVLLTLAFVLTGYVMAPTISSSITSLSGFDGNFTSTQDFIDASAAAVEPIRGFLLQHTDPVQLENFKQTATRIWESQGGFDTSDERDVFVLLPSFMVSELTRAFQIGLLLYLPFLAIDIIVSSVLMALGMMMVSPTLVSAPFKLLLFVLVDGWSLLVQGVVLSYV